MTTERAELNRIIDELPDETIQTMKEFAISVKKAYDQMKMRAYLAGIPEDKEELSEGERAELDRAAAEPGGGIPLDDLEKELGIGDYRAIFDIMIEDNTMYVLRVAHRREVYENL